MNTDSFFTKGQTHKVCQDYAINGDDCVALSDGCSNAPHSDIGARLLATSLINHRSSDTTATYAVLCGQTVAATLGMPENCLHATLLSAQVSPDGEQVYVHMSGDGAVVARKRDGSGYLALVSDYPSGAPWYPSYSLNPNYKANYLREFEGKATWNLTTYLNAVEVDSRTISMDSEGFQGFSAHERVLTLDVSEYDMVLLFSDGVQSFHKPGINGARDTVPLTAIFDEMLAVKTYAGEFITRRATKFLKTVAKNGWQHDDDFSVAAIYIPLDN